MAKASDNVFPKVLIEEGTEPASPPAGQHKLFVDTADGHLKKKDEAGDVVDLQVGTPDAGDVTYTPADNADWDGSADPGNANDALDQLASRTTDLEAGGAGLDTSAIHDNVASEISAITEKPSPVGNDLLIVEDSEDSNSKKRVKVSNLPFAGGSDPNHAYYQYLAAMLEPDAIETLKSGTFSYAVASNVTKILTASWNTRLSSAGRMEVRNQRDHIFLRGVTLTGLVSGACALIIDPALPTYADARDTYFDRLLEIATSTPQYLGIPAATTIPFLPGPYGAIVLHTTNYNSAWNSIRTNGDAYGWALVDEINDSSAFRIAASFYFAVNKKVACEFRNESGADTGEVRGSSLLYYICPAAWSVIADATSYNFRDDFMGASLDTATKWTRSQSTAGNVEIDTLYQWLKLKGNATWGGNGAYSQASISRANGKVFLIDIYVGRNATADNSHIVGFSDGGGHSYTNFSHGVLFTSSGAANIIKVYENGNDRGTVGSGFVNGTVYRVRITLGASNNAVYEIQGGGYGALGSASWTTITPGTTSSSTTPLHAGLSCYPTNGIMYLSDPKIY